MQINDRTLKVYQAIDFYNRYEKLSEDFMCSDDETFENYSHEEVKRIIEEFGYPTKYYKKENFFQIKEILHGVEFLFHICLKLGLAELIIYASDKNEKLLAGSVFAGIAKDMEPFIGREREGYIKKPRFRNYEELREILKEAFAIYEDFKREIIKEFGED